MGVRGLLSYLLRDDAPERGEQFDLVSVSQESARGIVLAADFYSVITDLLILCERATVAGLQQAAPDDESTWSCLSAHAKLLNGEPACYDQWITSVVLSLRAAGVELVFFVEGARGAIADSHKDKLATLAECYRSNAQRAHVIKEFCDHGVPMPDDEQLWTGESFLYLQSMRTLCRLGVKIVQCLGEVDLDMVSFVRRGGALAIISSDTDFLLASGCRVIFPSLINWEALITMQGDVLESFSVRTFSSLDLTLPLGLPDQALADFAVLCGNDISSPVIAKLGLHRTLGFPTRPCDVVTAAADLLRSLPVPRLEHHPVLGEHLAKYGSDFTMAVASCRDFYSWPDPLERAKTMSVLSPHNKHVSRHAFRTFLLEQVRSLRLPAEALTVVCQGTYWGEVSVEDLSAGQPRAVVMTLGLRQLQYALLRQSEVVEYGRSATHDFCSERIMVNVWIVPSVDILYFRPLCERVDWFWRLTNHRIDPNLLLPPHMGAFLNSESAQDRVFVGEMLVAAVLRYFVSLNLPRGASSNSARLQWHHFETLLAMWLCSKCDVAASVPAAPCRPSMRCVTMSSLVACVLQHGAKLAALLNLSAEFPEPKDIFGGSLFCALFSAAEMAFSKREVPAELRDWMSAVMAVRSQVLSSSAAQVMCDMILTGLPEHILLDDDRSSFDQSCHFVAEAADRSGELHPGQPARSTSTDVCGVSGEKRNPRSLLLEQRQVFCEENGPMFDGAGPSTTRDLLPSSRASNESGPPSLRVTIKCGSERSEEPRRPRSCT